jgi:hypothetical protein
MKMPPKEMNLNKKGSIVFGLLFFTPLIYGLVAVDTFEEITESINSWKYERIAFSLCLAFMCLIWMFPAMADYFAKDKKKKWMTIAAAQYSSLILTVVLLLVTFV